MKDTPQSAHAFESLRQLLEALAVEARASGAWGRVLRASVDEALLQFQVLDMTLVMQRPASETAQAAQVLAGTLRQLLLQGSKARMHATDRVALQLACAQAAKLESAQRLAGSQQERAELESR